MKRASEEKVYDRIIYLPLDLNRPVVDDGRRTTDLVARYQRSLILQGLLSEYEFGKVEIYKFDFKDPPEKVIKDLGLEQFKK